MFTSYPTYFRYRTLQLVDPLMRGEDVYALQTALNELSFPCGYADGILGVLTGQAIKDAQRKYELVVDGKAGPTTQKTIAIKLASAVARAFGIPPEANRGQIEHESGYVLGNYSPLRSDNTYDAGVAQRNTKYTDPKEGFDVGSSLGALSASTRKYYDLFAGVAPDRRRWALAQGAWNAPAFACYIAREEGATKVTSGMVLRPGAEARRTFETYVSVVSQYLP